MTQNKRYVVKGSEDFFLYIEDTTFTEDAHEGAIYNIYQVVDRLNEQNEQLSQIQKLCMDNRIPLCLTAHIPINCEHYHACFENHAENSVSFGKSKIANKILKIIKGDCNE